MHLNTLHRILGGRQVDGQGRGVSDRSGVVVQIHLLGALESHSAMSRTDPLASKLGKCFVEIRQHCRAWIENMNIEPELPALWDGPPIERTGPQDEGTRPIPEAAGRLAELVPRLKQAGIGRGRGGVAQNSP